VLLCGQLLGQNLNAPTSDPYTNGGTVQNELAVVSQGVATTATTTSTAVTPYIVTSPTSAAAVPAFLAILGQASCIMDTSFSASGVVYVVASTGTGGYCHPQSAAPNGGQGWVGFLASSSTATGVAALVEVHPGIWPTSGGGGSGVTAVSTGAGLTGGPITTSGTISLLSALPSNETATTQSPGDSSTSVTTDQFASLDAFAMGYTNVLAGTGADPCLQARSLVTGNFNSFVWPVSGSVTCSVDPTGGYDSQANGMWTVGMDLAIVPENATAGATINISTPWHFRNTSMVAFALPGRGAVSTSGNTGVRLAANSTFGTLAANRIWCSSSSDFSSAAGCQSVGTSTIAIAAEGTDAHCWNVTYESTAPSGTYLIRAGETIQLAGFASNANDGAFIVAQHGGTNCPAALTITTSTVAFTVYSNTISACAAGACGSHATVIAPTFMVTLGPAPTDLGSDGNTCIGLNGQINGKCVWNGTNACNSPPACTSNCACIYTFSDVVKNIGLTANGYPGVGGVLDVFADEGSGYLNDTSTVTRTPFPSFESNPFAGGQSQNNSGVSFIEAYCNTNKQAGEVLSCGDAAGYALNNAGASGTNITNEVAVWLIGVWGKHGVDTATIYAPGRCGIEIDSEAGLSGPEVLTGLHFQSYGTGVCIARQDVNQGPVLINGIHGTTMGTCGQCANTLVTIFNHSYNGSNPNATVSISGASFNLSGSGGTVNATIENDISGNNWTDTAIGNYNFNNTGGTITEYSTSNQFPWTLGAESSFAGKAACWATGGSLGHCTTTPTGGSCTCVSP